jgi:Protein of unknown function (DUF2829)
MTVYYGTKRINAEPLTKDGNVGYKVVYEDGYVSWSPRSTFEGCYRENWQMTFGHALQALTEGKRVRRDDWDAGIILFRVVGSTTIVDHVSPLRHSIAIGTRVERAPHIAMRTFEGAIAPWTASAIDLLAEDWGIVE